MARPWISRQDADVRWVNVFGVAAGRLWQILRHAPPGSVDIDRVSALADLRTAQVAMRALKAAQHLVPPFDQNLPWIEKMLAEEQSR